MGGKGDSGKVGEMSNSIELEEIRIEFSGKVCEQKKFYGDCYHCFSTAIAIRDRRLKYNAIEEEVDKATEAMDQTTWIPCSKRLPKKSGNYWCTFGGTNIVGEDYYTTESDAKEFFDNQEDYDPEDYEYAGWRSQNVIAWMPKPKPYKAESEA